MCEIFFAESDSPYEYGAFRHEYACHEGNYGMLNLLSGARAQEREASEQ